MASGSNIGGYSGYIPDCYHFWPTEKQLVAHYVSGKVSGALQSNCPITDLDIYRYNPDRLPPMKFSTGKKNCMYFFVYMTEENKERHTPNGYWKLVETVVIHEDSVEPSESGSEIGSVDEEEIVVEDPKDVVAIGLKKSYVYYTREAGPDGKNETNWRMEEFHAHVENPDDPKMKNWVLCKIRYKVPREEKRKKQPMVMELGKRKFQSIE